MRRNTRRTTKRRIIPYRGQGLYLKPYAGSGLYLKPYKGRGCNRTLFVYNKNERKKIRRKKKK